MSIEKDILNGQETPEVVGSNQPVTTVEVSKEERKAKAASIKSRIAEDGEKIKELRSELVGESKRTDFDIMKDFLENETEKINEIAEKRKGLTENTIGGKPTESFDKNFALIALENNKDLKFIDHSINEGTKEEIDYALRIINSSYRDRSDLKSKLEKKLS